MAKIFLAEDIEENTIDGAPLEEPASTESDGTASAKDVEGPRDFEGGKLRDKDKKNFIDALKEYPCLRNTSLVEYKDKLEKVNASKALVFCLYDQSLRHFVYMIRRSIKPLPSLLAFIEKNAQMRCSV